MNALVEEYSRRYHAFLPLIAKNLEAYIRPLLEGISNIDQITARAKDPESFIKKASSLNKNGEINYQAPLKEIQDQIGARVVVFYKNDVNLIRDHLIRYFQPIELVKLVPEQKWSFGYFGYHMVSPLPRDVIPKDVPIPDVPNFFELQIKTLFQHAWSQANHDLSYKTHAELTEDQERRCAYTAAQAWGADQIFEELRLEIKP